MGSSKHHSSSSSRKRRHKRDSEESVEEEKDDGTRMARSPNGDEENGERKKHHKSSRSHRHHRKHKKRDEDDEDKREGHRDAEDDDEERRHHHHKKKKEKKSKKSKKKKRKLEDDYEAISDEDLSGKEADVLLTKGKPDEDDLSSLSLSPSPPPKAKKEKRGEERREERRRSPSPKEDRRHNRDEAREENGASGKSQGAVSLSIEETNRLRAKLGLKPLKVDGPKEDTGEKPTTVEGGVQMDEFVHKPATNMGKTRKEDELREKLRLRREKRELEAKLKKKTPLLAEEDDDDNAANWVKKVRDVEKEKRDAAQRAKMLEEMDKEFGLDDLVQDEFIQEKRTIEKKKQYTGDHLKGVRVKHAMKDLAEGREVVLTLEDKNVLDENEDVLANVNLKELEKARKNIKNRSKKASYDAYDEDEEEDEEMGPALLKQYDEVLGGEKMDSFVLGGARTKVESTAAEKQAIKKKLKLVESLAAAPEVHTLAREYYTKEEYDAKFKKKKKKVKAQTFRNTGKKGKKKKGLTADDLLDDMAEPLEDQPVPMDVERDGSDADEDDFVLPQGLDDEELSAIVLEPDEAQLELEATLGRARRLREAKLMEPNQETSVEKLAKEIRGMKDEREEEEEPLHGMSEEVLTFNETAEFARSLGNRPDASVEDDMFAAPPQSPSPEPMEEEERGDEMDISSEDEDIVELKQDAAGKWSKAKDVAKQQEEKASTSKASLTVTDCEEEAGVSSSMVAAVKLACKKGYLDEGKHKKKVSGMSLAALKALHYTIEDKSSMDDDHKSRRGGDHRDRHSGPISDFKDKDNYKPDINLEYIDDQGRKLTPKEAFRYLSHKFHGKGSGKMKTEKRMKKMAEQSSVKQMSSTDTPLGTVGKMIEKQKESHTPFLVISGNKVTSTGGILSSLGKS